MKILAIRYSGLGDVVMLLQTLKKLKDKYEDCHITLLTDKSNSSIKEISCGLIDEIIPFDRKVFKQRKYFALIKESFKLLFKIRQKFDLTIDFQCFGETATISYLSNAIEKFGAPKKDKYNYGYTSIIPRSDHNHRSQLFSRIAKVDDKLDYSKLCVQEDSKDFKLKLEEKLDSTKKTIGLNIGSTQENRRWNETKFAELQKNLKEKHNILVFIGPSEKIYKDAFEKDSMFVEDVNLVQLSVAISMCDVVITNDTGPAHIAAALEIPTLTLFSTGDDWNVGALIDKKEFIKNENINEISPEEVLDKLSKLI